VNEAFQRTDQRRLPEQTPDDERTERKQATMRKRAVCTFVTRERMMPMDDLVRI